MTALAAPSRLRVVRPDAPPAPAPGAPPDLRLAHLPLATLVARSTEEAAKFRRQEPYDERFCRELLRRAICDRDEAAWAAVFAHHHALVLGWLRHHPARPGAGESDDFWVNRVFERFWLAIGPDDFATFPHLAALLCYLQTCVHSVLIDAARAQQTRQRATNSLLALRHPDAAEPPAVIAHLSGATLWAAIAAEARPGPETIVARDCLMHDLKPREVFERHPHLFATVADVHRIKRNLLDRLRRNQAVRACLDER